METTGKSWAAGGGGVRVSDSDVGDEWESERGFELMHVCVAVPSEGRRFRRRRAGCANRPIFIRAVVLDVDSPGLPFTGPITARTVLRVPSTRHAVDRTLTATPLKAKETCTRKFPSTPYLTNV